MNYEILEYNTIQYKYNTMLHTKGLLSTDYIKSLRQSALVMSFVQGALLPTINLFT